MITPPDSRIWLDIVTANRPAFERSVLIDAARKLAKKNPANIIFIAHNIDYDHSHYIAIMSQDLMSHTVFTVVTSDTGKEPNLQLVR